MATDTGKLVDADRGLIDRRIFIEPEIYEEELRQIADVTEADIAGQRADSDLGHA